MFRVAYETLLVPILIKVPVGVRKQQSEKTELKNADAIQVIHMY